MELCGRDRVTGVQVLDLSVSERGKDRPSRRPAWGQQCSLGLGDPSLFWLLLAQERRARSRLRVRFRRFLDTWLPNPLQFGVSVPLHCKRRVKGPD